MDGYLRKERTKLAPPRELGESACKQAKPQAARAAARRATIKFLKCHGGKAPPFHVPPGGFRHIGVLL